MIEQIDNLLAKLDEIEARFGELEQQIADPAVASDSARLISLSKEQGKLRSLVGKYREYKTAVSGIADAAQIVNDSTAEEDFKALAKEEIGQLERRRDTLLEEIQNTLVMADDMNVDSVIMEIRAGTGGEEAALFARDLYNMYTSYADGRRWKVEQLDFSTTEKGGFREVIFSVKGPGVWAELGYEGGGHRVQRVPETESQGRIHTSAATVAVLPEPEEVNVAINWEADVEEFVSRAGEPGGQNVNKVSSAIRLVHRDTGITVSMRDEKSQHKNRAKARRLLTTRLYDHIMSQRDAERAHTRRTMIGSGDRSQRVRTYNFPQNRCTDHRINLDLYSLDKIMQGELDDLIEALQTYDKEQRLRNL